MVVICQYHDQDIASTNTLYYMYKKIMISKYSQKYMKDKSVWNTNHEIKGKPYNDNRKPIIIFIFQNT